MKRAFALGTLILGTLAGTTFVWKATARAEPPLAPIAALSLNAGVPCICPQWPVGTYEGVPYYYAFEYYAGDDGCNYPFATYYIGDDAGDWPYICDECISEVGARAARKTAQSFQGLPRKIRWNEDPEFPTQAARDGAHLVGEDFVEFRNPLTKAIHRAKLFLIKAVPDEASHRHGEPQMLAVGFEVENNPRSEPTFRLQDPRRIKQISEHSQHVFRLNVGAVQYVVFLAKD